MSEKPSFFSELKRRNVYKVAVAFAVVGWLVIQIASIVLPTFHAPEWTLQAIIALVVIGFPAALISSQYAVAAPSLGKAIAVARAHLGQTDAALKEVRHLLTASVKNRSHRDYSDSTRCGIRCGTTRVSRN